MRRLFAAVCTGVFAAFLPCASAARDVSLRVFVDGRPLDARGGSALLRDGRAYVNVVRAVRAMNGLLTLGRRGEVTVTFEGRTLSFTIGRRTADFDGTLERLPGAPFVSHGDVYVPLSTLADLGDAKLSVDPRGRRAALALGAGDGFAVAMPRSDDGGDDVAPSPTQALAFVTSATVDAEGLHARSEITNVTARPYTLAFPSARQFAFVVSHNGSEVWNSLAEVADAGPSSVTFSPHETKVVSAEWAGYARSAPGRYLLRLRLATALPIDTAPVPLAVVAPVPAPTK